MVHTRQFPKICSLKFCDIWQNSFFYRVLGNDNFKMEVEQTNFVTHLIITVQLLQETFCKGSKHYRFEQKPSLSYRREEIDGMRM